MDNKKLLNFLLKDLTELNELFTDKKTGDFNVLEMEFLQTRLAGARKLVQILSEREESPVKIPMNSKLSREHAGEVIKVNIQPAMDDIAQGRSQEVDEIDVVKAHERKEETTQIAVEDAAARPDKATAVEPVAGVQHGETAEEDIVVSEKVAQGEMELEDEDPVENPNKRLSDVFMKEKSVNDSVDGGIGKLEHKLSNRPVASIQSAIGINDRFQYIRELFDGKPDEFTKTVTALDSKSNIKEAVNYLQENFKWKKNEASLKFVNLVKRRFTHD